MLCYTDGVIEERDEDGEPFGEERLLRCVNRLGQTEGGMRSAAIKLSRALKEERGGRTSDDATVFLIEWRAGASDHLTTLEWFPVRARGTRALRGCTAGSTVQPRGRFRGLRRRRGLAPGAPARLVTLLPWRQLAGHGTPAAHHRLAEQLVDAHPEGSRTATDTTARITVVTAMATITARPFHAFGCSLPRARSVVVL